MNNSHYDSHTHWLVAQCLPLAKASRQRVPEPAHGLKKKKYDRTTFKRQKLGPQGALRPLMLDWTMPLGSR